MAKVLFNNKFREFYFISSTRLSFANKKDGTAEIILLRLILMRKFLYT